MSATADFRPATLNIKGRRNDAISIQMTVVDESDAAVDLSGHTFLAQMRTDPAASVAATATFDTTDAADGILVTTFDLANLSGQYVWDLDDTTDERTYLAGTVFIDEDVSRA